MAEEQKKYKLSMTGKEADAGIRTGMQAGMVSGILFGGGDGTVRAATPGADYGYPLLQGNGVPTFNTAANLGQHYFDMAATQPPYEYICVGFNAQGFIWLVFGDTGTGFKISGYFASFEALEAAIQEGKVAAPTAGVSYGIGTVAPYDIYVWDAVNNAWVNNGPLGGVSGGSGSGGIPPHGNEGQALVKFSDADYDAGWGAVSNIAPDSVGKTQLKLGATYTELTIVLSEASWANNQQTVSVSGVTVNNAVIVSPAPIDYTAYNEAGVYCTAQGEGTLTFACVDVPTVALTVNVLMPR